MQLESTCSSDDPSRADRSEAARLTTPERSGQSKYAAARAALRILVLAYLGFAIALLAAGALLTSSLGHSITREDRRISEWLAAHRSGGFNTITAAATWFLNTVPVIAMAVVVVAILLLRGRRWETLLLIFGLVLEILVFLSVTFVIDRPRPAVHRLNSTPMTGSFPSGHTAAAVVLYGGIAVIAGWCCKDVILRWLARLGAFIAALAVSTSRVYRGMHFPTDVLAGALLGVACLLAATAALRAARSSWEGKAQDDRARTSASSLHAQPSVPEVDNPAELRA